MDIQKKIVECAFTVQQTIGNGLSKSIYENAFSIELANKGFSHVRGTTEDVFYKNKAVGQLKAGFIIKDSLLIDIMNKKEISGLDEMTFRKKLAIFDLKFGLLINFEERHVTFKRLVPVTGRF